MPSFYRLQYCYYFCPSLPWDVLLFFTPNHFRLQLTGATCKVNICRRLIRTVKCHGYRMSDLFVSRAHIQILCVLLIFTLSAASFHEKAEEAESSVPKIEVRFGLLANGQICEYTVTWDIIFISVRRVEWVQSARLFSFYTMTLLMFVYQVHGDFSDLVKTKKKRDDFSRRVCFACLV